MQWFYLGIACVFEVIFALSSYSAQGFTRLWPSVLTILAVADHHFCCQLWNIFLKFGAA